MPLYTVKREGRSYNIYRGATLVEGGFFGKHYADDACSALNEAAEMEVREPSEMEMVAMAVHFGADN